jgi:hypothetical protein
VSSTIHLAVFSAIVKDYRIILYLRVHNPAHKSMDRQVLVQYIGDVSNRCEAQGDDGR